MSSHEFSAEACEQLIQKSLAAMQGQQRALQQMLNAPSQQQQQEFSSSIPRYP